MYVGFFTEHMSGFYISLKNVSGVFVDIFHDDPPGTDAALSYQPWKTSGILNYTGQIIKIDRRFNSGMTGNMVICEVQVYGGRTTFCKSVITFV